MSCTEASSMWLKTASLELFMTHPAFGMLCVLFTLAGAGARPSDMGQYSRKKLLTGMPATHGGSWLFDANNSTCQSAGRMQSFSKPPPLQGTRSSASWTRMRKQP